MNILKKCLFLLEEEKQSIAIRNKTEDSLINEFTTNYEQSVSESFEILLRSMQTGGDNNIFLLRKKSLFNSSEIL